MLVEPQARFHGFLDDDRCHRLVGRGLLGQSEYVIHDGTSSVDAFALMCADDEKLRDVGTCVAVEWATFEGDIASNISDTATRPRQALEQMDAMTISGINNPFEINFTGSNSFV